MKHFLVTCILSSLCSVLISAQGNHPNPAAIYCERMGYDYSIVTEKDGGQRGICVFPDSSSVDAWEFYKGKGKKEFSYCERNGYLMETKIIKENGFVSECPYCVSKEGNIEMPMIELMERNGEPLIKEKVNDKDKENPDDDDIEYVQLRAAISLPTSFDWRNYNGHTYIGSIRDQASCGSCYAFGAVACAEGVYNKATGSFDSNRKEFSESFIMWCLPDLSGYGLHFFGCNGADYEQKEMEALTVEGICERSYFPYTMTMPLTCTHWNDPKALFSDWQRIPCNDINAIKTAIITYGIVYALVSAPTSFHNYSGGIYTDSNTTCGATPCSHAEANHAAALVGWGYDTTLGDYWILRNSWGTSWGESGYMRIKATSARIACSVSYLIPDPVIFEADNISESNKIPTGSNVEFIGYERITLTPGFKSESGSMFKAKIQPAPEARITTIIPINEFDSVSLFTISREKSDINVINSMFEDNMNRISIYPNPVVDVINIEGVVPNQTVKVELFDINGRAMNCEIDNLASSISVDVVTIPPGMYILNIQTLVSH